MKIGFQTIIFGRRIENLDLTLGLLASAGVQGVEFAQHPSKIFVVDERTGESKIVNVVDLVRLLRKHGLEFLGLAGGTLTQRVSFCLAPTAKELAEAGLVPSECRPHYLYLIDPDDPQASDAIDQGFSLAIHPHIHSKIERFTPGLIDKINRSQGSVDGTKTKEPGLFAMPDTAHEVLAGGNPSEVVSELLNHKIAAVHLKDWEEAYGRAYNTYAEGFTELGQGDVPIEETLKALRAKGYDGWLVVEQDYARISPASSIAISQKWLADRDLNFAPPIDPDEWQLPSRAPCLEGLSAGQSVFLSLFKKVDVRDLRGCYEAAVTYVRAAYDSESAILWSCSPSREQAYFLASSPENVASNYAPRLNAGAGGPIGESVTSMEMTFSPLARLGEQGLLKGTPWENPESHGQATHLIAIPVTQKYNSQQIQYVITVLAKDPDQTVYTNTVDTICEFMINMAEAIFRRIKSYIEGRVTYLAGISADLPGFVEALQRLTVDQLSCEGASVFLESFSRDRLVPLTPPNSILWHNSVPEEGRFYNATETGQSTVQCWQKGRTTFIKRQRVESKKGGLPWKSRDLPIVAGAAPDDLDQPIDVLMVPLRAHRATTGSGPWAAQVVGVARCRNKRIRRLSHGEEVRPEFTEDDASILSAIYEAAVSRIELLRDRQRQLATIAAMTHELNVPVNVLRASVAELTHEITTVDEWFRKVPPRLRQSLADTGFHLDSSFIADTSEDAVSWLDLMTRLISTAKFYSRTQQQLPLEVGQWYFVGDIIAPVKPQMRLLLGERNFSVHGITYSDFSEIKQLYVDRNAMQQVFFNILSNSIKYALPDPGLFKVYIDGTREGDYYRIQCRDWGAGIQDGYEDLVFHEGVRGGKTNVSMVLGLGIGLYIVRRIIEAHGGYVNVTNNYNPTEISIYLPVSLRYQPPAMSAKE